MQSSPRSAFWAMATLCAGVLCAYPFLRTPSSQPSDLLIEKAIAKSKKESPQAEFEQGRARGHSPTRVRMVSAGELSTHLSQGYPARAWENEKSFLEDLVAEGLVSAAPKTEPPRMPKLPTWVSSPTPNAKEEINEVHARNAPDSRATSLASSPFDRNQSSAVEKTLNRKLLEWPSESMALVDALEAERAARLVSSSHQSTTSSASPPRSQSARKKSYVFQPGHTPSLQADEK